MAQCLKLLFCTLFRWMDLSTWRIDLLLMLLNGFQKQEESWLCKAFPQQGSWLPAVWDKEGPHKLNAIIPMTLKMESTEDLAAAPLASKTESKGSGMGDCGSELRKEQLAELFNLLVEKMEAYMFQLSLVRDAYALQEWEIARASSSMDLCRPIMVMHQLWAYMDIS
ncbi:hypothetical protein DACRYDRAFT_15498 [Dacryopinax primogenitus]|uniref:Uncharacterized protein n=1 Tax=Dacryopinax primogenitus (strain DJM 731) TaxID=1858805 RepID=M5GD07_DACPD|nr:uncharacterized protein DACRYDRAFT_15498 [Dacryopinax primogenitus]EJU02078.1 hypothetical protein DACRYDRAFT_15498 [Dacryopinax primogenitus]